MSAATLRILIVGGYGAFGGRLAQLLAGEARITLIIAGRSAARAGSFCDGLRAAATTIAAHFDRDGDLDAQIKRLNPDIIVDASGPFQGYGHEPYRLVAAALAAGVGYMDLADGSDFVGGIARFDAAAKDRGVFILSGVSSFPVLTAAVVRRLARGLERVDTITGGVAPSPYAGVGRNVIRAIASYAGKPVPLTRNGQPSFGYGLAETMRYTICPPGRLPLRNIRFSLIDVPDLRMLPPHWPGLRSIWMGAGPAPEILHVALNVLASAVRLKLLPSLGFLAPVFHRAINALRWGEHRGGMFVQIEGATTGGATVTRSWHLLAEGDDGPLIPSMAVAAIVRRCLAGEPPAPGARPAVNALELEDYADLFGGRMIFTGTRESGADHGAAPLYQRILGAAWEQLPPQIRDMHTVAGAQTAEGRADIERGGNPLSRIIGWLFRFPRRARDVPVTVRFTTDGRRETWRRQFGAHAFSSDHTEGSGRSDKLLEEHFGPFSFGLALVASADRLSFVVRRWKVFGLPLPVALAPFGDSFEFVADGRFHFDVEIRLPLIGLIVRYRGSLEPTGTGL